MRDGFLSPENVTRGRNATRVTAVLPAAFFPMTPSASSKYSSTRKPLSAAIDRNHSMWQLEIEATKASSGSTAASTENGSRTTCGDDDAGTSTPPSKRQVCP